MQTIIEKLKLLDTITDHPMYHPEGTVLNHIKIVTIRAALVYGHPDIILAALLHDICKLDSGDNLKGYWSNPDHPKQAFKFCYQDDTRYFIKQFKGNVDHIANICLYHMACKEGVIKKATKVPFMDKFVVLDDMVNRHPFPQSSRKIFIPGMTWIDLCKLHFVGQSPLQQMRNVSALTVTANGTPLTVGFDQIWQFAPNNEILSLFKNL